MTESLSLQIDRRERATDLLAADNADFRDRVMTAEPSLSRRQLGSSNDMAPADLLRWERENAIFAVPYRGTDWFFCFQFENSRPHPAVARALAALPSEFSPWQRAAWFVSTNGWLDDEAPRDRLSDVEALVAAAGHEGEDQIG